MTLPKSILYLLPLLFMFPAPASAQIVNIAPNLALEDSNGLTLELKASVDTKSGNTESRSLTGAMAGRFRRDRDHLLFLNTGVYNSVDGAANDKAVMEHLRYRHDLRKWLASEVYVQHEYNKFRRLNVRALAGLGVRMILFRKQNLMLSCSPSCMIEYEKLDSAVDETGNPILDSGLAKTNHRLSNNLVANWIINKRLQVVSSTYFQPRIDELRDFRVLSELSLSVPLISQLEIEISTSIAYDRRPPFSVDRLDTSFCNTLGLAVKVF